MQGSINIEEVFPNGEWKKPDEYVIRCPYCGDSPTHNHCYVNPEKGVFHCYHCGEGGTVRRLMKDYGDGKELEERKGITEKKKYAELDFSKFPKVTGESGTLDRLAMTYLKGRGVTKDNIDIYDIRYGTTGDYYGRIIFPIYENGRIVCFSARSFLRFVKPKYRFPHYGETLLTSSEAIFGLNDLPPRRMVITEGVFDALAINKLGSRNRLRGASIMSKHLSDGQLNKLLRLSKDVWFCVMLDADANKDAIRVTKKLHAYGRDVEMAFLEKDDPDSASAEELLTALESARPFSFDLEIKVMCED